MVDFDSVLCADKEGQLRRKENYENSVDMIDRGRRMEKILICASTKNEEEVAAQWQGELILLFTSRWFSCATVH